MRSTLLVPAAILMMVGVAIAQPKVKILNDTHNFGQVAEGPNINHSFWIKSVGDKPLKIISIDPGCSCTEIPLRDSVLNPGESTTVEIVLRTRRLSGNIEKRPEFFTNAESKPFVLKFYASVTDDPQSMKPLTLSPAKIDVSQFGEKPRRRARFMIHNPTAQPYDIAIVDTLNKSFTVEMPKSIKANDSIEVTIMVRREKVTSSFGESFTFEVAADGYPRYTVPVTRIYKADEKSAVTRSSGKK